jgi:ABC-type lipoprotein export system ATPase subunit
MPILRAESVHKTYRLGRVAVPVLRGVNLSVEPGEWVAILGASGSGKSTLLHILGGLDRPDRPRGRAGRCPACRYPLGNLQAETCPECGGDVASVRAGGGSVFFNETSLASMSDRQLDQYRNTAVGFVFQFYHLLPELTVTDNVLLGSMIRHGLRGYAGNRAASRDRARSLLTSFGLGHRLEHRPAQLSGGERQRVAIARALINDPPVLLADEPTGNLDRKTGRSILDALIKHRTESARTLVIVTHDLEVAQRADRIVNIEDGKVIPLEASSPNASVHFQDTSGAEQSPV